LILHLIGGALLAAAWSTGIVGMLLAADLVHAVPLFGGILLLAIGYAWFGRWEQVFWIAEQLPILGLICTTYGLLLAVPDLQGMGESGAAHAKVAAELISALVANLLGMVGLGWLRLVDRVCRPG